MANFERITPQTTTLFSNEDKEIMNDFRRLDAVESGEEPLPLLQEPFVLQFARLLATSHDPSELVQFCEQDYPAYYQQAGEFLSQASQTAKDRVHKDPQSHQSQNLLLERYSRMLTRLDRELAVPQNLHLLVTFRNDHIATDKSEEKEAKVVEEFYQDLSSIFRPSQKNILIIEERFEWPKYRKKFYQAREQTGSYVAAGIALSQLLDSQYYFNPFLAPLDRFDQSYEVKVEFMQSPGEQAAGDQMLRIAQAKTLHAFKQACINAEKLNERRVSTIANMINKEVQETEGETNIVYLLPTKDMGIERVLHPRLKPITTYLNRKSMFEENSVYYISDIAYNNPDNTDDIAWQKAYDTFLKIRTGLTAYFRQFAEMYDELDMFYRSGF